METGNWKQENGNWKKETGNQNMEMKIGNWKLLFNQDTLGSRALQLGQFEEFYIILNACVK